VYYRFVVGQTSTAVRSMTDSKENSKEKYFPDPRAMRDVAWASRPPEYWAYTVHTTQACHSGTAHRNRSTRGEGSTGQCRSASAVLVWTH